MDDGKKHAQETHGGEQPLKQGDAASTPIPGILDGATQALGGGLLQRKIARRFLQRKEVPGAAAPENAAAEPKEKSTPPVGEKKASPGPGDGSGMKAPAAKPSDEKIGAASAWMGKQRLDKENTGELQRLLGTAQSGEADEETAVALASRAASMAGDDDGGENMPAAREVVEMEKASEVPGLDQTPAGADVATPPERPPIDRSSAAVTDLAKGLEEKPLPLPNVTKEQFGGNLNVALFAGRLAALKAARTAQAEVAKRLEVERLKRADTTRSESAHLIVEAEQAARARVTAIAKGKPHAAAVEHEMAKARRAAKAEIELLVKKGMDAVPAVSLENVAKNLRNAALRELKDSFQSTMLGAYHRFGSGWQKEVARRLHPPAPHGHAKRAKKDAEAPAPPVEDTAKRIDVAGWLLDHIESIKRGWMIGLREKLDFDTKSSSAWKPLHDFEPPRMVPEGERVSIPKSLREGDDAPPVAPEVAGFLHRLHEVYGKTYRVGNYAGHGGGKWAGAGYSIDLYLDGDRGERDERGFWKPEAAIAFLEALDAAAEDTGSRWRVLYNDFSVAKAVNTKTGWRNVTFTGNDQHGGGLNWHGPAPMVLHFHMDLAPGASRAVPPEEQ